MLSRLPRVSPDTTGQGISPYYYTETGEDLYRAAVHAVAYNSTNAQLYICGAYSGYTDATGHYPDQRFITRLNVAEVSTAVSEVPQQPRAFQIHPNPASAWAAFTYELPGNGATLHLRVRDSQGRVLFATPANGEEGQVVWDSRGLGPGVYTVELIPARLPDGQEGTMERTERLVIQP